ncbi:MAG: hypothetical protein WAM14_26565 [Candidatus Nitrosopolaris sp.]
MPFSSEYGFAYAHSNDYWIGYAFGRLDAFGVGGKYNATATCDIAIRLANHTR